MKSLKKITLLITLSLVVFGASVVVQAKDSDENDAMSAKSAKVTLIQAVKVALEHIPGIAANAEFSTDEGQPLWEIEVITADNKVYDVEVNSLSGVVTTHLDKADDEEDDGEE